MDYNKWPRELKTVAEAQHAFMHNSWFYWAPGDATRYRVSKANQAPDLAMYQQMMMSNELKQDELIARIPPVIDLLVVQVADGILRNDSLVINAPTNEFDKWNPARWADRGFPTGWWAGVRPLLAALGWTEAGYGAEEFHAEDNLVFVPAGG